jgi:hypothetical protein
VARTKSTASRKKRLVPEEIYLDLLHVARDIEAVECTAACLEQSLLGRASARDKEIAICLERNIANELGRICKSVAAVIVDIGWGPYTPLLESPTLGLRIRPALDKGGRKVSRSRRR